MKKEFILNGVFSKEELKTMLEEFDKPKFEVKKDKNSWIELNKNGKFKRILLKCNEIEMFNLSTVSRDMAIAMDDLMETKDVLDIDITGYYIYRDLTEEKWMYSHGTYTSHRKHFKTEEIVELAVKKLNASQDLEDRIKEWEDGE